KADRHRGQCTANKAPRPKGSIEPANRGPAEAQDADSEHGDQHNKRAAEHCLGERQDRYTARGSHSQELGEAAGDVAYRVNGAQAARCHGAAGPWGEHRS
ncbi:MAG: hypothetical protein KGO22_21520, partial [Gammaproteobacteria bacterium]|nr:hypothetical protein [Gammaproteobacteria bacterium]